MILTTNNKLKRALHFDALITLPGETRAHATSTIRIRPGLSSFESWPYPILELTLRNFQLLQQAPKCLVEYEGTLQVFAAPRKLRPRWMGFRESALEERSVDSTKK